LDDDTHMGINLMKYGLYVSTVMNVLFGLFFLSWSYDPKSDPSELACFLVLFGLTAGLLFLAAIYKIYKGADKRTIKHEDKVNIAVVLIIIGFFFGIVSPSLNADSLSALRTSMFLSSGADLIQQLFYGLAVIFLIYELAKEKARRYLYIGFSILMIVSFSRLFWSIFFIPQEGEILDVLLVTLRMLSILMLLLALGYFFLSLGYVKTAKSPKRKEKTESSTISSKEECPNCGSEEFTSYLDGLGSCESCGKTIRSGEKDRKEDLEWDDLS